MQGNARVGLVLMREDWSGMDHMQSLKETIENDAHAIVSRLEKLFEVLGPWVVELTESLHACQHALRENELDFVLLAFQTFAQDTLLALLLQAIGTRPVVLWCYVPWRRLPRPTSYYDLQRGLGPVGTFAALGTLRNLDVPFLYTFGAPDDPRLVQDLVVAGRAARVRQGLRSARFGLMPAYCDQGQSIFVDGTRLRTDLGPVVQLFSIADYMKAISAVPEERLEAYLTNLRQQYSIMGVSEDILRRSAAAALGLERLAQMHGLDLLAVNESAPELYEALNFRPALYPDLLEPGKVLYQPACDLGAATANYILNCLTDSPTFFLEMMAWDEPKNQVVGGHGGLQNPILGAHEYMWIGIDPEQCRVGAESASFHMITRPGRVTLFQLRSTPRGWQAVAASGMCLESQPLVEGWPHTLLRLDLPIVHFLNRVAEVGVTQHWVLAYGSVLHEIEAFCKIEKVPLEIFTY